MRTNEINETVIDLNNEEYFDELDETFIEARIAAEQRNGWPAWVTSRLSSLIRLVVGIAILYGYSLTWENYLCNHNTKGSFIFGLVFMGFVWLYHYLSCLVKASEYMVFVNHILIVFFPLMIVNIIFMPFLVYYLAVAKGILFGKRNQSEMRMTVL